PSVVRPSVRLPSSRSAWRTQFRIDCAVGSNFRASSSGVCPARTSSIKRRRNSGGYGGGGADFFGIVVTSDPNGQVSTKPGQVHLNLLGFIAGVFRVSAPRDLDEGLGLPDRSLCAALLENVIEVVDVAHAVPPRDFGPSTACWARVLVIEVEAELVCDGAKGF